MKDVYQWRITNFSQQTSGPGAIRVDAENNEFTVQTPYHLRNKGKCTIKVVGGTVQLSHYGTATALATRIVPDNTRVVYLRSNIPFLGHDSQQDGATSAILATCSVTGVDDDPFALIPADTNGTVYTCPHLPAEVSIKKWYLNLTNTEVAASGNYVAQVVPVILNLELQFEEDE